MLGKIAGAIAVVTGGGSGIGRAIAAGLAARGARHIVVADLAGAAAVLVADSIRENGGEVTPLALNVSNEAALAEAVRHIEVEIGPIGAWFSNAGVHLGEGLGSTGDWRESIAVNVMGHVHAASTVLPLMAARSAGAFVVTASAAGLLTDIRCAPYSASKHAAVALAEWLAIRHGDEGPSIHCACPEGVVTAMTHASSAAVVSGFITAEAAAAAILDGVEAGEFLILPHARTAEFERRRTEDRPRWLAAMRKRAVTQFKS